jgi:membrane protein implicated in regulation of membrane protease activity
MAVMLAHDHLFLFFAGSAAFSGLFLLIAAVSGALHGHGGHLWLLGRGGHGGHGSHGFDAGHGPHGSGTGSAAGHGAGTHPAATPSAHHGLHSGKAGPHLHTGKADLHLATGKHGHHLQTGTSGHDLQTGKSGQSAHGEARGHEAGERGQGLHISRPSAGMVVLQHHTRWSGFTTLLVSCLNVYGLLSFLFHMGVAGMIMRAGSKLHPVSVLLLSVLIGVAAALAWSAVLTRLFGDSSGLVTKENSQLEGREVKVTRTIRQGGTGEVLFTPQGRVVQNIPARSMDGQSIAAGEIVVVVAVHQGIALVERADLLSSADAGAEAGSCEDNEPLS